MLTPCKLDLTILNELKQCNILPYNILSIYKFNNNDILIINYIDNYLNKVNYYFKKFITKNNTSVILQYVNIVTNKNFIIKIILNSNLNNRIALNYEYINKLNLHNILKYQILKLNNSIVLISKLYEYDFKTYFENKKYNIKNKFNLNLNLIIKHLIKAIYDLHINNIIHGDIKPENVLISKTKNIFKKFKLAVCDLDYSITKYNVHLHSITKYYCPYYILNHYNYKIKDDIFCLGILITYILDEQLFKTIVDLHNSSRLNLELFKTIVDLHNSSHLNFELYENKIRHITNIAINKSKIKNKYKNILFKILEPKYELRISSKKLYSYSKFNL